MNNWNRITLVTLAIVSVGCDKPTAPPPTASTELAPSLSPSLEEPDIYDEDPATEEPSMGEFPLEEQIPVEKRIAKIHGTENRAWFRSKDLVGLGKLWYFGNVASLKLILRAVSDEGASHLSPTIPRAAQHWLPQDGNLEQGGKMVLPRSCGHSGENFGEYSVETKAIVPKLGIVTLDAQTKSDFAPSVQQDVCAPPQTSGGDGDIGDDGGDGGDLNPSICWDHYEWDLSTGDITLLWSTCPKQYATSLAPESPSPLEGSAPSTSWSDSRAGHTDRRKRSLASPAFGSSLASPPAPFTLVRVPFALVDKALPGDRSAVAARRRDAGMPEVILVRPAATAADIALAVASLRGLRARTSTRDHVEIVAVPRSASKAPPVLVEWSETILKRFQTAPVVHVKNHGPARVVYALLQP